MKTKKEILKDVHDCIFYSLFVASIFLFLSVLLLTAYVGNLKAYLFIVFIISGFMLLGMLQSFFYVKIFYNKTLLSEIA